GLKEIHSRDMYRDDVIMMHHGLELRLPFLDTKLIAFALSIPPMYKIVGDVKKAILREAAMELGLDHDIAYRKKLAAQYGSNFDKALIKLAKKNGFDKKGEYLLSITDRLIL
ncbi:ATP-binding protein, partial [Candidatus Woesearchaeota archaeon CG11_big_fil_rev_8_21_14_0_20_43_8]